MPLLIGADPELFVSVDGAMVSAAGLVPGTKDNPHPVTGGAIQVDGMALEFNITPAATSDEFVSRITKVLNTLKQQLPPTHQVEIISSTTFSPAVYKAAPPSARRLGCDPDFDAYTLRPNPRPRPPTQSFRTAAGHLHLGWINPGEPLPDLHFEDCAALAKALDVFVGIPSYLVEDEAAHARRRLYGKAGAFRPKPYGMEYRTLSNFWLKDPAHMNWVFFQAHKAFNLLLSGRSLQPYRSVLTLFNDGLSDKETRRYIWSYCLANRCLPERVQP